MMLTCREAIARMSDFLGRDLGAGDIARITLHLATCAPCRAYLRTLRRTIQLVGRAASVEMPDEMKRRLQTLLSERTRGTAP